MGFILLVPMVIFWIVGGVLLVRRVRSGRGVFGVSTPRPAVFDMTGVHRFSPEQSVKVRGGAVASGMTVSSPLVSLVADRDWIHVSGFLDRWYARTDVVAVESVSLHGRWGLVIRTTNGFDDGFAFIPSNPQQALVALESQGWPVPQRTS